MTRAGCPPVTGEETGGERGREGRLSVRVVVFGQVFLALINPKGSLQTPGLSTLSKSVARVRRSSAVPPYE